MDRVTRFKFWLACKLCKVAVRLVKDMLIVVALSTGYFLFNLLFCVIFFIVTEVMKSIVNHS